MLTYRSNMASFVFRTTLLRCAARSVATKYRTPNRWRSEQRSVWKSTFNMSLFYHQALYYCCTISVDRSKQSHIFCIISCNIVSYRLNKRFRHVFVYYLIFMFSQTVMLQQKIIKDPKYTQKQETKVTYQLQSLKY